jgi:hypothetical protein
MSANSGKAVVVKIGGSMAEDRKCLEELAQDIAKLAAAGEQVALVHGGGKDINRNLQWLGQEPKFVDGLRFTNDAAMDMVEMTLSGRVNKLLVRLLILEAGAKRLRESPGWMAARCFAPRRCATTARWARWARSPVSRQILSKPCGRADSCRWCLR